MGKGKTKKSVGKRFKKTGGGKILYTKAGAGHLQSSKSRKRKRKLRKDGVLSDTECKRLRHMLAD
jgi:large subunit ribosomal protein L35